MYVGDFIGYWMVIYVFSDNGVFDFGEIVWVWVFFEEDYI